MSTPQPDRELMELLDRIAAQEDSALKRLYERTSSPLFGLALRIVRNRDVAEDVLQEAFLSIWRGAGNYRASLSPPTRGRTGGRCYPCRRAPAGRPSARQGRVSRPSPPSAAR